MTCHTFTPLRSEIFGESRRCRDCGRKEAEHLPTEPYDWIQLADDEWGSDLMKRIADAHFAAHPELQFVEVHEHAGWHLGWHRSGVCMSTANDSAILSQQALELRRQYSRSLKLRTIIRRNELPKAARELPELYRRVNDSTEAWRATMNATGWTARGLPGDPPMAVCPTYGEAEAVEAALIKIDRDPFLLIADAERAAFCTKHDLPFHPTARTFPTGGPGEWADNRNQEKPDA